MTYNRHDYGPPEEGDPMDDPYSWYDEDGNSLPGVTRFPLFIEFVQYDVRGSVLLKNRLRMRNQPETVVSCEWLAADE